MTTNLNRKKTRIPVLPSVSMVKAKLEEINRDVAKLEVLLRVAIEMEAIDDKKEGK
tara:strand:+ start:424 stop:591 length:168 start_codon:yes stop_codon:yes gene_type:complete